MAVDESLLRSRAGIKPRPISPSEINDDDRARRPNRKTNRPRRSLTINRRQRNPIRCPSRGMATGRMPGSSTGSAMSKG